MKNWNELLVHEIEDLYDAEKQLVKALPKMAQGAADPMLKQAFESHLAETEIHVQRLEQVAQLLGQELGSMTCEGMKGLIKEGDGILKEKQKAEPEILDAALTGAAQKVEHYEMVAYESAIHLADQLGLEEVAELLEQTLTEEMAASNKLSELAGEEESGEDSLQGEEPARRSGRRGRQSRGGSRAGGGSDSDDRPRDSQGRFVSEDEAEAGEGLGLGAGAAGENGSSGRGPAGGGRSSSGGSSSGRGSSAGSSSSSGGSTGGSGGGRSSSGSGGR